MVSCWVSFAGLKRSFVGKRLDCDVEMSKLSNRLRWCLERFDSDKPWLSHHHQGMAAGKSTPTKQSLKLWTVPRMPQTIAPTNLSIKIGESRQMFPTVMSGKSYTRSERKTLQCYFRSNGITRSASSFRHHQIGFWLPKSRVHGRTVLGSS